MGIILHISSSSIESESRIFRAVSTFSYAFPEHKVHICGLWKEGLPEEEQRDNSVEIFRLKVFPKGIRGFRTWLFRKEWTQLILNRWSQQKVIIVQCHSLPDLEVGILLKKSIPQCKLIYDAHELETERNGLSGIKKIIDKIRERKWIKHVDETLVVNYSIERWYKEAYPGIPISVVKNIARFVGQDPESNNNYLRDRFCIPSDSLVFLYLGSLQKGRGIEMLIDIFSEHPEHHIVFVGYGPLEEMVEQASHKHTAIHFHEKVPENRVVEISSSADVGMSLIERTCLSYYYCLPNKLFEYLYAGIPVICSDFPEMKEVINRNNSGWVVAPEKTQVYNLISAITHNEVSKRKNAIINQKFETWETEKEKLIGVYKKNIFRE